MIKKIKIRRDGIIGNHLTVIAFFVSISIIGGNSMDRQRLFVDMDGTITVFKKLDTLEVLYEKGYFLNLEPIPNVLNAIKQIIQDNAEIEVYILSAVLSDSSYAIEEKNTWLDKYLPEVDVEHRIFPPCGQDKKQYVSIREKDFLLDDYTHNLNLWQPPARGIKLLNGINHTKGTWQYDCLRFDKDPCELADNIVNIMHGKLRIRDCKPDVVDIKKKGIQSEFPEDKLSKFYETIFRSETNFPQEEPEY